MTYNKNICEWDQNKNQINQKKHGIDFLDAIEIFNDYDRIEYIDNKKDYNELRYQTIGIVQEMVLFVVYTHRKGYCRIISARKANKDERETYYRYKKFN